MTSYRKKLNDLLQTATPEIRQTYLNTLDREELIYLLYDWPLWARDKQLPPESDWHIWLLMAGRGFGKTRAGAEWVRMLAMTGTCGLIALVGHTMDDVRHVMIEGASGILQVSPPDEKPTWLPSRRLLIWPNGAKARCYSSEDPNQLRGPEHEKAWCDEIAKWRYQAAWDNLMLALRVGDRPRALATTTPRPLAWLAALAAAPDTVLVQGSSAENRANLAAPYLAAMQPRYGGTALARQELDGVLTLDAPNALFRRQDLRAARGAPPPRDQFVRMVIGVDPAIGGGDETGYLFANDLIIALQICQDLYPCFASFTPARQAALISMAFNLGKPRLAGFRRMRAAINRGNWQGAADEAENSLWARQTRHRATDVAARLRGVHKP